MGWFVSLLNLLSGGLAQTVLDGYKARLADGQNVDKLAADLAAREIEARKQIAIAELGSWFTALPRVVIEMSIAIYIAKVIVWDICLNLGSTDAIRGEVAVWAGIVVTGMYGSNVASKVVNGFVSRR